MPLSSDGVLLEEGGNPLLAFGFALAGRLPLSFLQDELLVGGLGLVLVVDGPRHLLPQSGRLRRKKGIHERLETEYKLHVSIRTTTV